MAKQYEIDGKVTVTQNATLLRTERENNLFRAVFENRINTGQVAVYNVDCFADIRHVTQSPDGTIELDFYGITSVRAYTTKATGTTGYRVGLKMWGDTNNDGNLNLIYQHEVDLGDSFDTGVKAVNGSKPIHLSIPAGEKRQIPLRRVVRWLATAQVSNDEFYMDVGGFIINPIEFYVPCAIRENNRHRSLNDTPPKKILKRDTSWIDVSKENIATKLQPNKGHTRLRLDGVWKQAPITTSR